MIIASKTSISMRMEIILILFRPSEPLNPSGTLVSEAAIIRGGGGIGVSGFSGLILSQKNFLNFGNRVLSRKERAPQGFPDKEKGQKV